MKRRLLIAFFTLACFVGGILVGVLIASKHCEAEAIKTEAPKDVEQVKAGL